MSSIRSLLLFLCICLLAPLFGCGSNALPSHYESAQFGPRFQAQSAPLPSEVEIAPEIAAREQAAWQALSQLSEAETLALRLQLRTRNTLHDIHSSERLRNIIESLLPALKAGYERMLHPRVIHSERDIPNAQPLAFASHDGHKLKAAYLAAEKETQQAVVVLHGYQLNAYLAWKKYRFLQRDYNLLFLDQRGHNGQSGDVTLGLKEQRDLEAPILWLKEHDNQAFALFGESMGASTAIVAGARWAESTRQQFFPLQAVWSDAAYQDLESAITAHSIHWLAKRAGLAPEFLKRWAAGWIASSYIAWMNEDFGGQVEEMAAARTHLPRLVQYAAYGQVHSLEDQITPVKNARHLESLAREHAHKPVYTWYTQGQHVQSYKNPEYATRVLHFLETAFRASPQAQAYVLSAE